MHKATKIAAALVLSLGLAACGGGAAASSTADTTASSAADTTASSAADTTASSAVDTTASSAASTTQTATKADYVNTEMGIEYTKPANFVDYENEGSVYMCINESTGSNVNIIISDFGGATLDDATMEALKQVFTNELKNQGIEDAEVQSGTHTLDAGTFPAIKGTGKLNGTELTLEQIYVESAGKVATFTCTVAAGESADSMMAGLVVS